MYIHMPAASFEEVLAVRMRPGITEILKSQLQGHFAHALKFMLHSSSCSSQVTFETCSEVTFESLWQLPRSIQEALAVHMHRDLVQSFVFLG